MNNQYSKKIQCILKEGEKCKKLLGPAAGPRGATGPTGPTGPAGAATVVTFDYGSKYDSTGNTITLTANTATNVPLNNLGPLSGITGNATNSLTITKTGTYLINYGFSGKSSANTTLTIEVAQNTNMISSSSLMREVTANTIEAFNGSVIALLNTADTVSLRIEANDAVTITPSDGTNAYLTITQIA